MLSRKFKIIEVLFVFATIVSLIASFSIYKISGLGVISISVLFVSLLVFRNNHVLFNSNKKEVRLFFFGWFFVYFISIFINYSLPKIGMLNSFAFGLMYLSLSLSIQKRIINLYLWSLAILLLFAMIEYLVFQFTHIGVILGNVTRSTDVRETFFVNLIFNIVRTDTLLPRFQFLTEEPGLIGTLCGFLLFYTSKVQTMKFPFFVFLIGGVLSFSLAYYIFLGIFLIVNFKANLKNAFFIFIVFIILFQFLKENVDVLIISRVEETEDIDNRTSETFDIYFEKAYKNNQLWFGVGANNIPRQIVMGKEGGNAGAKKWIFEFGIIGFIIIFFSYCLIYRIRCGRKLTLYDWIFLLVYWISFYQRETIINPYSLLAFLAVPMLNPQNGIHPKLQMS